MVESGGHLSGPMAARAQHLRARFDHIRRRHRVEHGRQREDVVREFLQDFLPRRLEIGTGEIAAANGDVSPQMDLIVYDGLQTPLLDRTDSSVVVPVEGVYAVIEVASSLTASKLREDAEKIRAAKRLPKVAYFEPGAPMVTRTTTMWGRTFNYFPVLGFCFGYESAKLATLTDAVEELDDPQDRGQGVDMVCSLSHGCVASGEPSMTEAGTLTFRNLSACPTPDTIRVGLSIASAEDQGVALMHFYLLAGGLLAQAESQPIRMAPYMDA